MSYHPIYAFGYTGRKLDDIVEAVSAAKAVLVDIRYSPRSRAPMWSRSRFEAVIGDRYLWAGNSLGNRLYRTDAIEIVDLDAGIALIEQLYGYGNVALMCVCASPVGCHRTVITEALRERGFTTIEGLSS